MTRGKADTGLDFEVLRLGIERCDADLMLGFYADDAYLSIVNADAPQNPLFVLCGKAEIAKHLRAVFGQEASHRVEREVVGEDRVTFREACEYPDRSRMWVETTLEVRGGKIIRQVDVVSRDARTNLKEEIGGRPSARQTRPGADTPPRVRLPHYEQATEKEDLR